MADIKLKRSAVQGKTPLSGDLALGEIAINTFDGKVFIKKDNGAESIVEFNALEEGTWVPILGGTTSQSGQTYSVQQGVYTKIGNLVVVQARIAFTAKGSIAGDLVLKGLPFTPGYYGAVDIASQKSFTLSFGANSWFHIAHILTGIVSPGNDFISLEEVAFKGDLSGSLTTDNISNSTTLTITCAYRI